MIQGCRLTGKPSVSKIEILGSNPSVPANFYGRPDSRVSQTVLKTAAANHRVRFDSVAFRHLEMSPNWHGSTPLRCREKSCERSNRSISAIA